MDKKKHGTKTTDKELLESIEMAKEAGVKEENILHNREEIDKFFES